MLKHTTSNNVHSLGTTEESLPSILAEMKNLTEYIKELFDEAEAASMCIHYLTSDWKHGLASNYAYSASL